MEISAYIKKRECGDVVDTILRDIPFMQARSRYAINSSTPCFMPEAISVNVPETFADVCCILHEMGHIVTSVPNQTLISGEVNAWLYCYLVLPKSVHDELTETAVACLTAFDECKRTFTEAQIRDFLKQGREEIMRKGRSYIQEMIKDRR